MKEVAELVVSTASSCARNREIGLRTPDAKTLILPLEMLTTKIKAKIEIFNNFPYFMDIVESFLGVISKAEALLATIECVHQSKPLKWILHAIANYEPTKLTSATQIPWKNREKCA
jgi:hypothetical protein